MLTQDELLEFVEVELRPRASARPSVSSALFELLHFLEDLGSPPTDAGELLRRADVLTFVRDDLLPRLDGEASTAVTRLLAFVGERRELASDLFEDIHASPVLSGEPAEVPLPPSSLAPLARLEKSFAAAFSPGGARFFCVGDGRVRSADDGREVARCKLPSNALAAVWPDDDFVVVTNTTGVIAAYDASAGGRPIWRHADGGDPAAIAWHDPPGVLTHGVVRSLHDGAELTRLQSPPGNPGRLGRVPGGGFVFLTGWLREGLVARLGPTLAVSERWDVPGTPLAFDPTAPGVVLLERPTLDPDPFARQSEFCVYDTHAGSTLSARVLGRDAGPSAAWSPDGAVLTLAFGGALHVLHPRTLAPLAVRPAPYASHVAWSADGGRFVLSTWSQGGLWDGAALRNLAGRVHLTGPAPATSGRSA